MTGVNGDTRTAVVTGASGLIGRHLCQHLVAAGWRVRAMVRTPRGAARPDSRVEEHRLVLPDAIDPGALRDANVVVHAAYATRGGRPDEARRINEEGTARLRAAARDAGVARFVFLSSLSAVTDADSYYARSKRVLESTLDPARDLVIRPGLVLARDAGLAHRMWRAVERTRVAPLFAGGRQVVQTIHIDDLCGAILRALDTGAAGPFNLAEPDGVTMREFLALLARGAHVRAINVPIPAGVMLSLLRLLEASRIRSPITVDNLQGLLALRHVDTQSDLARLGVVVRSAAESIADLAALRGRH